MIEEKECKNPPYNLKPKTLLDLQKELYFWQEYNFGEQSDRRMVLGICEESGELCHAHLKLEQGIRGNQDQLRAEAKDAIGDICIYALNLLSNHHENVPMIATGKGHGRVEDLERIGNAVLDIFCCVARIVTAQKMEAVNPPPPIRLERPPEITPLIRHTHELFMAVNTFCAWVGWDLEEIIRDTWKEVGARDWKQFPKDAHLKDKKETSDKIIQEKDQNLLKLENDIGKIRCAIGDLRMKEILEGEK